LPVRDLLLILLLASLVLAQIGVSLWMPRGIHLTIASDLIQGTLLLFATASIIPNAFRSRTVNRRIQLFWVLMSMSMLLWLVYQGLWNYFEVWQHAEVPNPFAGDIILFLHLVPMMAALALRPHQHQEERDTRIGMLDFGLLLTWWIFLYVYSVLPWQYAEVNEPAYTRNFNHVYLTEKLALLFILALFAYGARGGWRQLYGQLLGATALYASSSYVANWAIGHQVYYSGSFYDIPLTISIAWMAMLGRFAWRYPLAKTDPHSEPWLGVWVTRFGMLAVFSLPWFALHAQLDVSTPSFVQKFRIEVTLATWVVMGVMVFWRQSLLGSELSHLLQSSRKSFEDLKVLQTQLLQSEKLASLGRLVGGAAHEINNPLTAMLGYSDLLSASPLDPGEHRLATEIGEQVRRTRTLVSSLLTFARQSPAQMSPVDMNSVVQTAVRLLQPQLEKQAVTAKLDLASSLPPVLADSSQLLHVCLHIAGQTRSHFPRGEDSLLYVRTIARQNHVVLEFAGDASVTESKWSVLCSAGRGQPGTLSLSACCRIIREHGGRILASNSSPDGVDYRIELPVAAQSTTRLASADTTGTKAAVTS